MSAKTIITAGAVISAIWLIVVCQLALRFNIPSGDGILYSLPLAVARHPLDLGVPYLNGFDGYGSSWGHHWPGAMWLKGVVFFVLPYSRAADVAVLSLFQGIAAASAAWLVWKATGNRWSAAAAMILLLSDRLLLLACAGNRFESIAVAVVLLLFANSVAGDGQSSAAWRAWMLVLAFLCPTLHPYALVLGALILGYDWLYQTRTRGAATGACAARTGAFMLGCFAVTAWFVTQPDALRQFTANLAIQKSFYQNWRCVLDGLGNYRLGGGVMLWVAGLGAAGWLVAGWPSGKTHHLVPLSPALRFLAPALLLTVIAIHTITRCENFHYLAFGTPFAVIMVCVAAAETARRWTSSSVRTHGMDPTSEAAVSRCSPVIRWLPAFVLGLLVLPHATILPYRVLQFIRAGCPNLNSEISSVLERIPAGRTVYIPHPMWPAAAADNSHIIRWFTLPLASHREVRERYERLAYANTKPGDILIVDNEGAGAPDRFGLYPTFPLLPPDPTRWRKSDEQKHLFSGAVPWGLDLSVYEFTGHP